VTDFILREISPDDSVSGLSLGAEAFVPLKTYLAQHAKRYHRQNAGKTYVFVHRDKPLKVVAYITLVCSYIKVGKRKGPVGVGVYDYPDFPAIKIARLAVDRRHREHGLGTQLFDWALAVSTIRVMPHVGCRFLVVDSKQESVGWYTKRGFTMLDTAKNRKQQNPVMFIDIGKLAE
jgi:GNAT superfamily N-acetyltransferase